MRSLLTPSGSLSALVAFVLLSSTSFAQTRGGLSAKRSAQLSSESIIQFHELRQRTQAITAQTSTPSALQAKKAWKEANWKGVPALAPELLQGRFQDLRDEKMLKDAQNRDRRLTWLFPDDGCYARAELAARHLQAQGALAPAKIFAFGSLAVNSPNHPDGVVTWWYHVAPIVRVGTEYYVFDPAIEAKRPLKAQEWLDLMHAPNAAISICSTNSYDPNSACDTKQSSEQTARVEGRRFLAREWERLQYLGRSPEAELGHSPPWKN
ncbi:MAG: protein-glutamine glutaminase family protein [Bdellovibrio sp.]